MLGYDYRRGRANRYYDAFRQKLTEQAEKFRRSGVEVDFGVSFKDGKVSVVARRKK